MHPHQVPHYKCCLAGYVYKCAGGCTEESLVGDDYCNAELECYCEEKGGDCGGKPPICSTRWARSTSNQK
jgi:hypothetical protein